MKYTSELVAMLTSTAMCKWGCPYILDSDKQTRHSYVGSICKKSLDIGKSIKRNLTQ